MRGEVPILHPGSKRPGECWGCVATWVRIAAERRLIMGFREGCSLPRSQEQTRCELIPWKSGVEWRWASAGARVILSADVRRSAYFSKRGHLREHLVRVFSRSPELLVVLSLQASRYPPTSVYKIDVVMHRCIAHRRASCMLHAASAVHHPPRDLGTALSVSHASQVTKCQVTEV